MRSSLRLAWAVKLCCFLFQLRTSRLPCARSTSYLKPALVFFSTGDATSSEIALTRMRCSMPCSSRTQSPPLAGRGSRELLLSFDVYGSFFLICIHFPHSHSNSRRFECAQSVVPNAPSSKGSQIHGKELCSRGQCPCSLTKKLCPPHDSVKVLDPGPTSGNLGSCAFVENPLQIIESVCL